MKLKFNLNLPQKSILGFKVLSSLHSSLACYLLLIIGKVLNIFFGLSKIQIIAGSMFNVVLNVSIVILIINLLIKRKQIKRIYFIFLNSILFIYFPFSLYNIGKYIMVLLFSLWVLDEKFSKFKNSSKIFIRVSLLWNNYSKKFIWVLFTKLNIIFS